MQEFFNKLSIGVAFGMGIYTAAVALIATIIQRFCGDFLKRFRGILECSFDSSFHGHCGDFNFPCLLSLVR